MSTADRLARPLRRGVQRARRMRRRLAHERLQRRLAGPRLLTAFAEAYPRAFFIEVGSNDGEQQDHLREHILNSEWRGIMVEPLPFIFERLAANYGSMRRIALENVAISERNGELPFFHLRPAEPEEAAQLPDWYDATGSFSRELLLNYAAVIPGVEARIVETAVPAVTFRSLCERHGVGRFDLLVIDTEGHDWQILRTVDLERFAPRLIVYEHFHLGEAERREAFEYLADHGYATMSEGLDTFALREQSGDALTRRWKSLTPALPGLRADEELRASATRVD